MKLLKNLTILLCIALAACPSSKQTKQDQKNDTMKKEDVAPTTKREDVVETLHGVEITDPYRWLEDVKSDEVQQWMTAQDAVARGYFPTIPGREELVKRFGELYYVDSVSAPIRRGKRFFYNRRHADKEKRVYYFRNGEKGEEKVLLDPNTMSEDGSTSVGRTVVSWDGKKLAYTLKENNADESTLYVMDIDTLKTSDIDVIPGAKYASPSWTPDGKGFYYTKLPVDPNIPTADRPGYADIRFHKLGTDPKNDPIIKEKLGDPQVFLGSDLSKDGRYLFYYVFHGWTATDIYYKDLKKKDKEFKPLVVGKPYQYSVDVWKDNFYIYTNDSAPRFRVMKVNGAAPKYENWKEIIPEYKDGSVIDGVQVVGEHLVLSLLSNVYSDLRVHDFNGRLVRDIELPGIGYSSRMAGNAEDDTAYFSFQSFTQPSTIYKTKVSSGATEVWTRIEVPVDPSPYKVEQVWFASKDGTKVPMFVITRKDVKLDGSTPFILNGYGGFNVSLHPYFRASIYPWLEAGGGYAIPNLRGGGEFGEDWHKAGMLGNKQNVFDDFIGAAEFLIEKGYTSSDKLAIRGGSNGGLLVGAAMTQRPELFRAVVCAVPLLDMVRFHLFGSGKTWVSEYGSSEDPEQFKYIHAYSPYHHVKDEKYPALLMLSADTDDRVDPMHARKFVAKVQHHSKSEHPVLLRIEKNAGHGGADLIKQYVQNDADTYAFLMKELGMVSE